MMSVKFLEPNSQEFRELLYERLKQLIVGLREGLYTWQDYFYVVTSLVALGDLSRDHAAQLLRSPTLSTLDSIFNKRTVKKVGTRFLGEVELPDETPCLVVVPNRDVAARLIRTYCFLSPLEKFSTNVEYGVCSVYKAISTLVMHGGEVRSIVLLPDDFTPRASMNVLQGNFSTTKFLRAYVALLLLCRLWNINVVGPIMLKFDFERDEVKRTIEASGRVKALLEVLDELEHAASRVIYIKTPVDLSEFLPAICVAFIWKYNIDKFDIRRGAAAFDTKIMIDYDEEFYNLLWKVVGNLPREVVLVNWWTYGKDVQQLDESRYELAKSLGFNEHVAKKIATWKVESINDIVRLLKDLRYNYRDDKYFREVVIPRIATIFNTRPEVLIQLFELDLL